MGVETQNLASLQKDRSRFKFYWFNIMKKTKVLLVCVYALALNMVLFTTTAKAQYLSYKIPNPSNIDSLEELITLVVSLMAVVMLLTFGGLIVLSGWDMMTSRGSEEKIMKSKRTLAAAILGFIIIVLAPTITNFVLNLLGVEGLE